MWLGGAMVWGFVLTWGKIGFDVHDRTQEGPRFDFLRRAFLEGRLPLHIGIPLTPTARFLAIPDTLISPQVILLRRVEPGSFVLLNTLFLYSLGFLGLILLGQRLRWSPFTVVVVFLLVMLNGHPVAQIAVGHSMWASYFLLPFFALLLIELSERGVGWGWVGPRGCRRAMSLCPRCWRCWAVRRLIGGCRSGEAMLACGSRLRR